MLKKVCSRRLWRWGGTAIKVKIWIKPKESSFKAFFTLFSSFYTSRGGGLEAPIRQLARWGLLLKLHRTSLAEKNQTSILVSVFTITFAWLVRAVAHFNNFRNGAERLNNLNERKIRRFQPVSVAAGTLSGLCENWAGSEGEWVDAPSKVALRLPIGETFSREANGTRGA